jgi:hypothetical protein
MSFTLYAVACLNILFILKFISSEQKTLQSFVMWMVACNILCTSYFLWQSV